MDWGNASHRMASAPLLIFLFGGTCVAGDASVTLFGSPYQDVARAGKQTIDGGYVLVGDYHNYDQGQIIKVDEAGMVEWARTYKNKVYYDDYFAVVHQLGGSGYIVGTHNPTAIILVRLDPAGNSIWQKAYKHTEGTDVIGTLLPTEDSGFLIAGTASDYANGVTTNADYLAIKVDGAGNPLWEKKYGGPDWDILMTAGRTKDGGFVLAGHSGKNVGNTSQSLWLVKIDGSGQLLAQWRYSGAHSYYPRAVRQTPDGGYLLAGDYSSSSSGVWYGWAMKVDASGAIAWQKSYINDPTGCHLRDIREVFGGDVLVGFTKSGDGWIAKIDQGGVIKWETALSTSELYAVSPTDDGDVAVFGKYTGKSSVEALLTKIPASGNLGPSCGKLFKAVSTTTGQLGLAIVPYSSSQKTTSIVAAVPSTTMTPAYLEPTPLCGNICPTITLQPVALVGATAGKYYDVPINASGGRLPYSLSIVGGALPPGMSLNASTGHITGTCNTTGNFPFTIRASDHYYCKGARDYSLPVSP